MAEEGGVKWEANSSGNEFQNSSSAVSRTMPLRALAPQIRVPGAYILEAEIVFASNPLSPSLPCWKRQFLLLGVPHSAERWIFVPQIVVLD
jgi:hypothetical protein